MTIIEVGAWTVDAGDIIVVNEEAFTVTEVEDVAGNPLTEIILHLRDENGDEAEPLRCKLNDLLPVLD